MTPKQKAAQLRYKYSTLLDLNTTDALVLQCALIAVEFAREFITGDLSEKFDKTMYLLEVKEEIEKL